MGLCYSEPVVYGGATTVVTRPAAVHTTAGQCKDAALGAAAAWRMCVRGLCPESHLLLAPVGHRVK